MKEKVVFQWIKSKIITPSNFIQLKGGYKMFTAPGQQQEQQQRPQQKRAKRKKMYIAE